jgi:hypothetical protein
MCNGAGGRTVKLHCDEQTRNLFYVRGMDDYFGWRAMSPV